MRVVCLVPSWTETLIAAGVDVVGRTRYCLYPEKKVPAIPVVGGTKKADWNKIEALQPDLVLFDREENTREMAEECMVPWHSTHVTSMEDVARELRDLTVRLGSPALGDFASRWEKIISTPGPRLLDPPALIKWHTPRPPVMGTVVYTIWAQPWMAAGGPTFIGSVMKWCGWRVWGTEKYPEFDPEIFKDRAAVFLCSTEPFPFADRAQLMSQLPGPVALVDGEKLSWFGVRSLVYLESLV